MKFIRKIAENIENDKILRHILFWLLYSIANISIGLTSQGDTIQSSFVFNFLALIPQILASYYFTYFIISKLFLRRKYLLALVLFLFGTYIFSVIARILVVHVGEPLIRQKPFEQETIFEILTDIGMLWHKYIPMIYSVAFIFLFVKFFLDFKRKKEQETQLSKEKSEAELKMLKAQLILTFYSIHSTIFTHFL